MFCAIPIFDAADFYRLSRIIGGSLLLEFVWKGNVLLLVSVLLSARLRLLLLLLCSTVMLLLELINGLPMLL